MAKETTHAQAKKHLLIPAPAGLCCYVCKKPMKNMHTDVTTTISTDPLTVRHNGCCAGSTKWLQSEHAERSELKQFFISDGEDVVMGQVPEKVKKSFPKKDVELTPEQRQLIGRVKYMAYMTTVLKEGQIDWEVEGRQSNIQVICSAGQVSIIRPGIPYKYVLDAVPEANASEELRSYLLGLADDKLRKEEKTKSEKEGGPKSGSEEKGKEKGYKEAVSKGPKAKPVLSTKRGGGNRK